MKNFLKKYKFTLILISIALILYLGIVLIISNLPALPTGQVGGRQVSNPKNQRIATPRSGEVRNDSVTNSPTIPHPEPEFKNPITLKVNDEEYKIELQDKMTVYGLMQALSASSIKPFIFTTIEYPGLGQFVDSINDLKNDRQNGKYWIYYLNGQPAQIGISNYLLKSNDLIEWKYGTSF
ncbi:MAG: hypothetical protein US42_C0011G0009 [Candidatus Magasanikbacteria bacterium GW2011_GWC2_37_14]|uniref:Transcobalamin-like C-terminal domain-containing protein n=1 Tax=Candidatus Magasanikbacteria bacterium GW2011_GWC2_37_14 TaxID=1619046 RepID=A0A0G0JGN4_9BACT|nr:MAG: hypothetical protein US42_C0011G0009 [Candidatus Magasanikbacteria bacterium GW2011_GWC2_37_14]